MVKKSKELKKSNVESQKNGSIQMNYFSRPGIPLGLDIEVSIRPVSMQLIITETCKFFDVEERNIYHGVTRRNRELVETRQMIMKLAKSLTHLSLTKIGASLGGYDHATVLYGSRNMSNLMEIDYKYKTAFNILYNKIKYNDTKSETP